MIALKYLNFFLALGSELWFLIKVLQFKQKDWDDFPFNGNHLWGLWIDVIIRAHYESLKGKGAQTGFFKMQVNSQCQHCEDVYVKVWSQMLSSLVVNLFYI